MNYLVCFGLGFFSGAAALYYLAYKALAPSYDSTEWEENEISWRGEPWGDMSRGVNVWPLR